MSIFLNIAGAGLALGLVLTPPGLSQGYQLVEVPARWRFSFESVSAGSAGDGSLLGLHYELLDVLERPGLFAGVGGYGSVSGDLGGFFAGGLDLGWRRALGQRFTAEAGSFVGAGGGSELATGSSGFMLRPFVALERLSDSFGLRLELANPRMPGTELNELTVSLGLSIPVHFLSGHARSDWAAPISIDALELERWELESGFMRLNPSSSSRRLDGTSFEKDLIFGGLKLNARLGENSHLPFEAWGAIGGGAAGARALLGGYGRHGALLDSVMPGKLEWELELLGGLAGGGSLDTGGGLVAEANAGLRARLAPNWSGHLALSHLEALGGDLSATGLQFGLAWDPRMLRLAPDYDRTRLASEALPSSEGLFDVWQFGTAWKLYRPRTGAKSLSGENLEPVLHLLGVSAERHINEHFSVLVRASGAMGGNVGGYSEGLAGLRASFQPLDLLGDSDLYVEYDMGAAGGGSVDVGSGLIHQTTAGLAWSPFTGVEVGLGIGRVGARFSGDFSASVFEAGITFDVARLIARH